MRARAQPADPASVDAVNASGAPEPEKLTEEVQSRSNRPWLPERLLPAVLGGLVFWLCVTAFILSRSPTPDEAVVGNEAVFVGKNDNSEAVKKKEEERNTSAGEAHSDRAALDAILDELMAAHRRDVKTREETIIEAEDLPVYSSKTSLVVTMADAGYAACATRLVDSVRKAGRWGGAVTLLTPTDDGTQPLPAETLARMASMDVDVVQVPPELAGGEHVRGAGAAAQYAKVTLLVNSSYRQYDTILYLDADGMVEAPLQPLLDVTMPAGRVIAMPTWPSAHVKHDSFYTREINFNAISEPAAERLRASCPDRTLVGITAWFLLKPQSLPSPDALRRSVTAALEDWRPAFRFNDQGLWNALFYNTSAFYPLCISGPKPRTDRSSDGRQFRPLLVNNLDRLSHVIDSSCGPGHARRKPMYKHPLKDCIPEKEWERKRKSNAAP
eukprot:TRINITY_DN21933_c0_g1_i2.p1 TRINITY_DN21933_c0_g1~~TRINITY_DN21933_c0_g1_i2.p1  ORF type:complete len:442 (-),score=76.61 TRINITY_DN21933_c0_g1_i2:111-1436(-)